MSKKFIAISGSLRKGSYNTALLRAAKELAPAGLEIEIADIKDFPLYNFDMEANMPKAVLDLKEKIKNADGVIFATPEYNRSTSGVLKNAIDWISRPYGTNSFDGKTALVLGASTGAIGTAVAQSHLKEIILYLGMKVIGQPEFYLGLAKEKFSEEGVLIDEKTKSFLVKTLTVLL